MKKTVYTILILSIVIGVSLMVFDIMDRSSDGFRIPARFKKVVVDLSDRARSNELLFENHLEVPSSIELFMQSNAAGEKTVEVISESEILGLNRRKIDFNVGQYTGNSATSATFVMDAGKYSVYLTSPQTDGQIAIGYQESPKESSEFERLYRIHEGDLDNPPAGYEEIFSADLLGRSWQTKVIYTLSLATTKDIGLSVYTSAQQGTVSVDLIGNTSSLIGLVNPARNRICDQLETRLTPGEYQFKVTCENADGQLYVFLKQ
ncbi:MAG: hypothetical protein PHV61_01155 [Limnochordia bacterium]|jgi:hypothetical protein|nr:hypothetical protein [Limnochordia bacterium]MDD4519254.1 hypothetical protein [Limnochordia bacterium]